MIEPRRTGQSNSNLETCLEFRNADIKAFLRHLHERSCEKCWTVFTAVRPGNTRAAIFPKGQRPCEVPAKEGRPSAGRPEGRSIDQWLRTEYFLIPPLERPIAGSNEWFRWLEEFQQRHPVEVSQLRQPLANRACQVLWNSQ